MSSDYPPTPAAPTAEEDQVIIFGHSALLYWWPVWVIGYVMALLTWLHGVRVPVESSYDTDNMVFTKQQDDCFRHWVLGLGAGPGKLLTGGRLEGTQRRQ